MAWVLQSLLSLPVGAFFSAQFDGDLVSNNVNSLIFHRVRHFRDKANSCDS